MYVYTQHTEIITKILVHHNKNVLTINQKCFYQGIFWYSDFCLIILNVAVYK